MTRDFVSADLKQSSLQDYNSDASQNDDDDDGDGDDNYNNIGINIASMDEIDAINAIDAMSPISLRSNTNTTTTNTTTNPNSTSKSNSNVNINWNGGSPQSRNSNNNNNHNNNNNNYNGGRRLRSTSNSMNDDGNSDRIRMSQIFATAPSIADMKTSLTWHNARSSKSPKKLNLFGVGSNDFGRANSDQRFANSSSTINSASRYKNGGKNDESEKKKNDKNISEIKSQQLQQEDVVRSQTDHTDYIIKDNLNINNNINNINNGKEEKNYSNARLQANSQSYTKFDKPKQNIVKKINKSYDRSHNHLNLQLSVAIGMESNSQDSVVHTEDDEEEEDNHDDHDDDNKNEDKKNDDDNYDDNYDGDYDDEDDDAGISRQASAHATTNMAANIVIEELDKLDEEAAKLQSTIADVKDSQNKTKNKNKNEMTMSGMHEKGKIKDKIAKTDLGSIGSIGSISVSTSPVVGKYIDNNHDWHKTISQLQLKPSMSQQSQESSVTASNTVSVQPSKRDSTFI